MKAIVLAAGQGLRLRPLTDDRPKCLVPFLGRPILERAIEKLRQAGISDLTVVTGWRADRVEALGVRTRRNPRFASTNMVQSLFCAEDQMDGDDVLVVYGDIVFAGRLVAAALADRSRFGVVVDRAWRDLWQVRMPDPLADAETLRLDGEGNIRELGKRPRSYADIEGQYVGLVKLAREAIADVRRFYHGLDRSALYDGQDFDHMYMTSFIQAVIDRLMPVRAILVDGGWVEVDSLADLEAYGRSGEWLARRLA